MCWLTLHFDSVFLVPMIEPCTIMHQSIAQIAVAQSKHLQYIVLTGIEATVSTQNGNISHLKSR